MNTLKLAAFLCLAVLISCKENKAAAQQSGTVQKGIIEKIGATKFNTKIEKKKVQLIDVRTPDEYNQGHIPNAKNVNFYDADFVTQLAKLDKNRPVYLYCKSGGRSGRASAQLRDAGFSLVYDLKGGFAGWKTAGLPIIK